MHAFHYLLFMLSRYPAVFSWTAHFQNEVCRPSFLRVDFDEIGLSGGVDDLPNLAALLRPVFGTFSLIVKHVHEHLLNVSSPL